METSTINIVLEQIQNLRKDARDDHKELLQLIDDGFAESNKRADGIASDLAMYKSMTAVETVKVTNRLAEIEGVHKTAKWVVGSIFIGGVGMMYDALKHHLLPWLNK